MLTILIIVAITIFILLSTTIMSMGALLSQRSSKLITSISVCIAGGIILYSILTYPNIQRKESYVNMGSVKQIQIIGGVSKYTDIKITTDKFITTVRAGHYPNVYVGARLGKKYTVEGGQHHTLYCVDNKCYSHSTCEWNMGCWKRTLGHFKDE